MKYGNLTLGQIEAGINKIGGEDAFMRLLAGEINIVPAKPADPKKLLELVTTVSVPACEKFVAKEHFKVDTSRKAKVKIAFLWDNFSKHFLPKTEEGVLAGEIKVHKLLQSSLDAPIMTELGDPTAYSTTLADMWVMLEKQPNGEKGALLINGYANIFYIHDTEGNLWAVSARWYAAHGGWNVGAVSVGYPRRWFDGTRVLSR